MADTKHYAIARIETYFAEDKFKTELAELVAFGTESQTGEAGGKLRTYLTTGIAPRLERAGFKTKVFENPIDSAGPIMVSTSIEDAALLTALIYDHGDVVYGQAGQWSDGMDHCVLQESEEQFYGRGVADNKGQHLINNATLEAVITVYGRLGFNVKLLLEISEKTGSKGLAAFCAKHRNLLAADVLIVSDGPRVGAEIPTLFLGSRGVVNFKLNVRLCDHAHHSGNWAGLLRDPAMVLAHALVYREKMRLIIIRSAVVYGGIAASWTS